jgi:hypothetical protein
MVAALLWYVYTSFAVAAVGMRRSTCKRSRPKTHLNDDNDQYRTPICKQSHGDYLLVTS